MAKVNFRQQKRQRENARMQRQNERLMRRGERPVGEVAGADAPAAPVEQATAPASASAPT